MEEFVELILDYIGEDRERDGLKNTPTRVVASWNEIYSGYKEKDEEIQKMMTTLDNDTPYHSMVLLRYVEFYSMCEHHMLPFFGKAHIAYIPETNSGRIVGISKLARLVDVYSRRLQVQERIGEQVTEMIMSVLKPK